MTAFRHLCILLWFILVLLTLPSSVQAQERTFFLEGHYMGHETGDLSYLLLRTQTGEHSMVCDWPILQALDALNPQLPIVVEFSTTRQYVEGAGQEIDFQVIQSVFVPDQYAPDFGIRISKSRKP